MLTEGWSLITSPCSWQPFLEFSDDINIIVYLWAGTYVYVQVVCACLSLLSTCPLGKTSLLVPGIIELFWVCRTRQGAKCQGLDPTHRKLHSLLTWALRSPSPIHWSQRNAVLMEQSDRLLCKSMWWDTVVVSVPWHHWKYTGVIVGRAKTFDCSIQWSVPSSGGSCGHLVSWSQILSAKSQ